MSKFYTSVEIRGNSVLYRGYEDGEPVQGKIAYQPHVYLPTNEDVATKVFMTGQPVKKKIFESISDMKEFVETHKDLGNFNIYGCSNLVRQFTGNSFRKDIDWDYSLTKIWFFDIETRVDRLNVDAKTEVKIRRQDNPDVEKTVTAYDLLNLHTDWDVLGQTGRWGTANASGYISGGFPDVTQAREECLMISLYDRFHKKMHLWSLIPAEETNPVFGMFPSLNFECFATEKEMLKNFVMFFANNRVDILSGWNSELFDIPFLVNRIKAVLGEEIAKYLSPWRQVKSRQIRNEDGSIDMTYDISGVVHLDYLQAYKKFNPGSKESFKLDYIAELELGEKKVDVPGESFRDGYILHPQTFLQYSAVDSMLLNKLEDKLLQVRLAMQLAYIAKCQIPDVLSSMRLWESIIYNYFLDLNIVETWDKERNEKHKIVGAYVHEPVPGKYGWTVSVDAISKYPSLIMQNNISPETIVDYMPQVTMDGILADRHVAEVPDGCIMSANGLITRKGTQGFIPILIKRMFDLRKKTKNLMLDKKKLYESLKETDPVAAEALADEIAALDVAQSSFKVASNSFYGVLGLVHFKYYDYRMAEAVTSSGQVFIKRTMRYINAILNKILGTADDYVIASDTDSVYFQSQKLVDKFCKGKSDTEIVNFLEKFVFDVIQPTLNKKLVEFASTMGVDDCKIFYKLECIGPGALFVAKKKYAFDILYSEGVRYSQPKMKVMGIEIVRSSTPNVVKDYLKESLALCLRSTESELQKKVRDVKKTFLSQSYQDISFPRGVNGMTVYADDASIYRKGCPIHVRGSLLYNHTLKRLHLDEKYPLISDGDKVKFVALKMPNTLHENVIAFPAKLPPELGLERFIDYKMQFQKAYLAPLQNILDAIGWEAEEKVTLDFG